MAVHFTVFRVMPAFSGGQRRRAVHAAWSVSWKHEKGADDLARAGRSAALSVVGFGGSITTYCTVVPAYVAGTTCSALLVGDAIDHGGDTAGRHRVDDRTDHRGRHHGRGRHRCRRGHRMVVPAVVPVVVDVHVDIAVDVDVALTSTAMVHAVGWRLILALRLTLCPALPPRCDIGAACVRRVVDAGARNRARAAPRRQRPRPSSPQHRRPAPPPAGNRKVRTFMAYPPQPRPHRPRPTRSSPHPWAARR